MSRGRWLIGLAATAAVAAVTWSPPPQAAHADAAPASPPGPQIAAPWRQGVPELGVDVYWESDPADSDETVGRKARRLVDHVVGMEANAIAVSFPFFTDSITSSVVRSDSRTPTPAQIGILLHEAERAGLRTTIRPLLDQTNLWDPVTEVWRGTYVPSDRNAWFAAYQAFLAPYLAVAASAGADAVIVGAELGALQGDPRWAWLAADARKRYPGRLGYSANWDAYDPAAKALPVDYVAIDAYPILGLASQATEQQMVDAWRAWLDRTAAGVVGADLVLSEVGGAAESEMLENPSRTQVAGQVLDEGIQRRWFAAACRAARDRHLGGLYWWKLDFHVDPASADPDRDLHDSFLGRQAEGAIRECFSAWGAAR